MILMARQVGILVLLGAMIGSVMSLEFESAINGMDNTSLGDSGGTAKVDSDCDKKTGKCGWTFQDAFCYHSPFKHEKRKRIHSFAIVHGELYLFVAMAIFKVPLGHPPFNVSKGIQLLDLSNELTNNMFRNYRMVGYNYATLALEIDDHWQIFFMGSNLQDINSCCSQIWHTQQLIRKIDQKFQPRIGTFRIGFNAFFGDGAKRVDNAVFSLDRVITSAKYFYHVQQRIATDNVTLYYRIVRYDQRDNLQFDFKEYVIYPVIMGNFVGCKEWYLESKELLGPRIKEVLPNTPIANNFAIVMVKNGYIYEDKMYLTKLDSLEIYQLSYPLGKNNHERIKMTWEKNFDANSFITCKLWNSDNAQYHYTCILGLFYTFAVIITALLVVAHKANVKGKKFAVGPMCSILELSDDMIFTNKKL